MKNNVSNKGAGLSAATVAQGAGTASAGIAAVGATVGGGIAAGAVMTTAAPIAVVGLVGWGVSKLFD